MFQSLGRWCAVLFFLVLISQTVLAGTTGKVIGQITDSRSGEPLIGANVVLEGTSLGGSTDVDGFFSIINVPPGTYKLTVEYIGYASHSVGNVRVSVDRTTTQNVKLSSEAVEGTEVIVEASRPAVEMDRTHSASIVSAETVELMPVTEIEEVLELQAGVVSTGGELHFRGGRAREVAYIIDGVPVTNAFDQSGGNNVTVENSMIEELEVISGTFNAEYGSAQSGIVNIVTKRPASTWKGSFQTFIGDFISGQEETYLGVDEIDFLSEKDYQFSLSGPLISEKLGFSVSGRYNDFQSLDWFERRFNPIDGWRIQTYRYWANNQPTTDPDGVIFIPDSLSTGDLARGPLRTGFSGSINTKLLFVPHPKLTFSYQMFGSLRETEGAIDPLNNGADAFRRYAPDEAGTTRQIAHSHFFRAQHFPTDNFFYNFAFSYQRNDGENFYRKDNLFADAPGDAGIQPISAGSNGFLLGGTGGYWADQDGKNFVDQYLVSGDLNWQINKYNFIKAGFIAKQHWINVYGRGVRLSDEWRNNSFGEITPFYFNFDTGELVNIIPAFYENFGDYWNAMQGFWRHWELNNGTFDPLTNTFTPAQRFEEIGLDEVALYRDYDIKPIEAAFYVQDKLELGDDIIVNAGLRLDIFDPNNAVPINFRTESFNLGREANLQDASTKYQLSPRLGISFPISATGAFHGSYGHFFQMPSFAFMYNEPLVVLTPIQLDGRTLGNADLKPEKTIAYEIGLQQEITSTIAVDITAYYKDFRNLLGLERINTIDNVSYNRYVNRDYGNTKGITFGFTKSGGLISGGLNYTLAFANGSNSDPNTLLLINTASQISGEDVVFVDRQIRALNWDQRHTGNAYINFAKRGNWSVGLVGFLNSGVPFSPTFVGKFEIPEREYRNTDTQPTRWSVDLKAKKHLNLFGLKSSLFMQVDNLFDHLNHEEVYRSTGQGDEVAVLPFELAFILQDLVNEGLFNYDETILNPDNFSPPRRIQMGLEFKF